MYSISFRLIFTIIGIILYLVYSINSEEFICHGVPLDALEDPCSNHGSCTEAGICACNSTYTGDFCSLPICNGIHNERFVVAIHPDGMDRIEDNQSSIFFPILKKDATYGWKLVVVEDLKIYRWELEGSENILYEHDGYATTPIFSVPSANYSLIFMHKKSSSLVTLAVASSGEVVRIIVRFNLWESSIDIVPNWPVGYDGVIDACSSQDQVFFLLWSETSERFIVFDSLHQGNVSVPLGVDPESLHCMDTSPPIVYMAASDGIYDVTPYRAPVREYSWPENTISLSSISIDPVYYLLYYVNQNLEVNVVNLRYNETAFSGHIGDHMSSASRFSLDKKTSVCSQKGVCEEGYADEPPQCMCSQGYLGPTCEYQGCFGYNWNSSSVCSSHGSCSCAVDPSMCQSIPGECTCEKHHDGGMCENPECFHHPTQNDVFIFSSNSSEKVDIPLFSTHPSPYHSDLIDSEVLSVGFYGRMTYRLELVPDTPFSSTTYLSVYNYTRLSVELPLDSHEEATAVVYDYMFDTFHVFTDRGLTHRWHLNSSGLNRVGDVPTSTYNFTHVCYMNRNIYAIEAPSEVGASKVYKIAVGDDHGDAEVLYGELYGLLHLHCDISNDTLIFYTRSNLLAMHMDSGIMKSLSKVKRLAEGLDFSPAGGHMIWPETGLLFTWTVDEAGLHTLTIENYHSGSTVSSIVTSWGHVGQLQTLSGCGHGVCIDHDLCRCAYGDVSAVCAQFGCFGIPAVDDHVCSGRGTCRSADVCECTTLDHGEIGNQCQVTACDSGWFGVDCDVTYCSDFMSNDSLVCNGRGGCVNPEVCNCADGWLGVDCASPSCNEIPGYSSSVCSGRGECASPNNCTCIEGFAGLDCEFPVCFGIADNVTVCSGHGSCTSPDICECEDGWNETPDCASTSCGGINSERAMVCSGHGACIDHNQCACTNASYTGDNCEMYLCHGVLNTDPYTCSRHGTCSDVDHCECLAEYSADDCSNYSCFDILVSADEVCSHSGECVAADTCLCFEGFEGENCETFFCNGLLPDEDGVCNNHGTCHRNKTCLCEEGYVGEYCDNLECFGLSAKDTSVCSSHGMCVNTDVCDCINDNYRGISCNDYACFGVSHNHVNSCGSNGECVAHDECQCSDGWAGNNCTSPICFGLDSSNDAVCSGHGECSSPGVCTCDNGYTSANCERVLCFGKLDNATNVCWGAGDCVAPDICACEPSYSGSQCQEFPCFLNNPDDPAACNQHGTCHSSNNCTCHDGYTGEQCQDTICFGKIGSEACSAHGICIAPDICSCSGGGYTGTECSHPVCFGLSNLTATAPCNGYDCVAPDTCSCEGFENPDCTSPLCFGEAHPALICNGRGSCTGPNACSCLVDFEGPLCQYRTEFFLPFGNETNDSTFEQVESVHSDFLTMQSKNFKLFGESHEVLRLSTNSFVTFGNLPAEPTHFSLATSTEPLVLFGYTFNDLSPPLGLLNKMYYRQSSLHPTQNEKADMQLISEFVQSEFYFDSKLNQFNASWYFVVTADHVGYYPAKTDKLNSVQLILSVDDLRNLSMIIYNFKQNGIEHPATNPVIGLTSGVSSHYVDLMQSADPVDKKAEHIISMTNVQTKGFYSFPTHEAIISESYEFVTTCGGVPANASSVCNGRGNCTSKDLCVCFDYSKGSNCEIYCKDGGDWSGVYCEKPRCFNLAWDNTSVCSGHGSCTSPNHCECEAPYYSADCSKFSCYGIDASNSSVCSGHGTCTRLDTCECSSGWTHSSADPDVMSCAQFTCGGRTPDDLDACYNGGTCAGPDQCVGCMAPFFGDTCNEAYRYVDPINGDDTNPNNTCLFRETPCKSLSKVFQLMTFRNRIVLMGGTHVLPLASTYIRYPVYFLGESGAVISTSPQHAKGAVPLIVNLRSNVEFYFSNVIFRDIRSASLIRVYYGSNSVIRLENVQFVNGFKFFDYEGIGTVTLNATNVVVLRSKDSFARILSSTEITGQFIHVSRFFAHSNTLTGPLFDVRRMASFTMEHSRVSHSSSHATCLLHGEFVRDVSLTDCQIEHISAGDAPVFHLTESSTVVVQNVNIANISSARFGLFHVANAQSLLMSHMHVNDSVSASHGSIAHVDSVGAVTLVSSTLSNTYTFGNGGLWLNAVNNLVMQDVSSHIIVAEFGALLFLKSVSNIQLERCTIRNAHGIGSSEYLSGEGSTVYVDGSGSIQMYSSTFDECDSSLFTKGNYVVKVDNCTITRNMQGAVQINENAGLFITFNKTLFANNYNKEGFGGAISLVSVSSFITVSNCSFSNHSAVNGGALFLIEVDRLLVSDSLFSSCIATEGGGAVYIEVASTVEMYRSTFTANEGSNGGAILLKKVVESLFFVRYGGSILDSCIFARNSAKQGGSLYYSTENVAQVKNSFFSQNHASRSGGAIHAEGYTYANTFASSSDMFSNSSFSELLNFDLQAGLQVSQSTFVSNTAGDIGGALSCFSSGVRFLIQSSLFDSNKAEGNGGSFFFLVHSGSLVDSMISRSSAVKGSAIYALMATSMSHGIQLMNVQLIDCEASREGTIYLQPTIVFKMMHSSMLNCQASSGNLYNDRSIVTITNSRFEKNSVFDQGGVISMHDDATLYCQNSTFISNTASYGGVVYINSRKTIFFGNMSTMGNSASLGGTFYFETQADNSTNSEEYGTFDFDISNSTLIDHATIGGGSFFVSRNEFTVPPKFTSLPESVIVKSTTNGYGPIFASNPDDIFLTYMRQTITSDNYWEFSIADTDQDAVEMKVFPGQLFSVRLKVCDIYKQVIPQYPGLLLKASSSLNMVGVVQQVLIDSTVSLTNIMLRGKRFTNGTIFFSSDGVEVPTKTRSMSVQLHDCPQGYRVDDGELFDECVQCPRGSYSIIPSSPVCYENCVGFTCSGGYSIEYNNNYWIEVQITGQLRAIPCLSGHCVGGNFDFLQDGLPIPFLNDDGTVKQGAELQEFSHTRQLLDRSTLFSTNSSTVLEASLGTRYIGAECIGNREGVLCGTCVDGYELMKGNCVPCTGLNPFLVVVHTLHLLGILAYIHYSSQNEKTGAAAKIFIIFMQVCTLIVDVKKFGANSGSDGVVVLVDLVVSLFSFEMPSFGGGEDENKKSDNLFQGCPFPRPGYWLYGYDMLHFFAYLVVIALCSVLGSLICCACTRYSRRKAQKRLARGSINDIIEGGGGLVTLAGVDQIVSGEKVNPSLREKVVTRFNMYFTPEAFFRTFLNTLIYNFLPLTNLTMSYLLGCFSLETGEYVMLGNTSLACWTTTTYWLWSLIFIPVLLLIVFGPSIAVLLLALNRHRLDHPGFRRYFGPLYSIYKPKYFWFEWVFMTQRTLLIVGSIAAQMLTISYGVNGVQFMFYSVVIAFSYLFVLNFSPYKSEGDNSFQKISLFMTLLILGVQEGTSEYSEIVGVVVGLLLMATCASMLIVWIILANPVVQKVILKVRSMFSGKPNFNVIMPMDDDLGPNVDHEIPREATKDAQYKIAHQMSSADMSWRRGSSKRKFGSTTVFDSLFEFPNPSESDASSNYTTADDVSEGAWVHNLEEEETLRRTRSSRSDVNHSQQLQAQQFLDETPRTIFVDVTKIKKKDD
uniref:EGF-like domain-containing protein n=1 Tax=Percolomonas cosmopolitus TaxID=63605 RepID=A0A7S1PHQ5_9EUKA